MHIAQIATTAHDTMQLGIKIENWSESRNWYLNIQNKTNLIIFY